MQMGDLARRKMGGFCARPQNHVTEPTQLDIDSESPELEPAASQHCSYSTASPLMSSAILMSLDTPPSSSWPSSLPLLAPLLYFLLALAAFCLHILSLLHVMPLLFVYHLAASLHLPSDERDRKSFRCVALSLRCLRRRRVFLIASRFLFLLGRR